MKGRKNMKAIGLWIIGIILTILLLIGITYFSLYYTGYFAPKFENVRRNVFEQTRSYNEGKVQDLAKYRDEYMQAKDEGSKAAIQSTIKVMFANYNGKLPFELEQFLHQMRGY